MAPLTLYNRNAPFSNEQMLLIGSVPVSALYAFSGYVLRFLIIAVLVVLTAGLFQQPCAGAQALAPDFARLSDEVAHARESRSSIPMLSATGIIELDRFSSAFTQLGREVLDTSTKFLRIMDMASVELGGYELRSAPDSIYVTDNFFDLLGMPGVDADDLTAQSFRELLQRFERSCPYSLAPDGAMLHIRLPSGKERYLRIETTHEDGTQVGLAEDATANTLEKLRIEHECDYDTLTDLYNRRAFHRICAEFFCSPEKLGHAALLLFDLDNLKQINDTFGHDWGDEYIRRTGECFCQERSRAYRLRAHQQR